MWLKKNSLSFKLIIYYVISVLFINLIAIAFFEYQNYGKAIYSAIRDAEIGIGYINGATPNITDSDLIANQTIFSVNMTDIHNHLNRFTPLVDIGVQGGVLETGFSLTGPISDQNEAYYNIKFNVTNLKSGSGYLVGPIALKQSSFPMTILAYQHANINRLNQLFYLPIPGHANLVFLVSMNSYSFPVTSWTSTFISVFIKVLPLVFCFSLILGLLIFWFALAPLRKITNATDLISASDLKHRVNYVSNDEIGRLALSFDVMANRLEQAFSSQKRFISDAAHELRTPLASLKTSVTKALGDQKDNSEDVQLFLEFLNRRINVMENLINDLLLLARADEGVYQSGNLVFDVNSELQDVQEAYSCLFDERQIRFEVKIENNLLLIMDQRLFVRAVSNLLENAGKYTPKDGLIYLKAFKANRQVNIIVGDTGSGIEEANVPFIFDRFFKGPESKKNGGFGLGLSMCKSIINSNGGNISVETHLGKGTVFTIKLPEAK